MDETHKMQDIEFAKSEIRLFVSQRVGQSSFADDLNLFDAGLLNSLFVIELMTFIERAFSVKIEMDDLDMANFHSIDAMISFLKQKGL